MGGSRRGLGWPQATSLLWRCDFHRPADQDQRPCQTQQPDEILEIAVGLFAARGYHGVSMDDIGAAAGVTGPALYHHFAGKEAMLVAALIPVSEGLLAGGGPGRRAPGDPRGSWSR